MYCNSNDFDVKWLEQDDNLAEDVPQPNQINDRGDHICQICNKSFRYESQLRIHVEPHGERKYFCPYGDCNRQYKYKKHFDDHMKEKHNYVK